MRETNLMIDLNKSIYKPFKYMQYDNEHTLNLILHEDKRASNLETYHAIAIFQVGEDIFKKECNIENNCIKISIDKDITSRIGKVSLEVVLSNNVQTITTFTIFFNIEGSIIWN